MAGGITGRADLVRSAIPPLVRILAVFLWPTVPRVDDDGPGACRPASDGGRLDPDQVRALRAVAQQLLRPSVRHPDSGETPPPEPKSLLADEPVREFSFIGLFNGAPDLSERSEEILREEFAKRADADR
jgi:hypothetical protein